MSNKSLISRPREQNQLEELPVSLARDHSVFTVSHLEPRHLIDIINVLERHDFPSTKWFKLGFRLRLRKNTLDIIEEGKHKDDPGRCLLECLDQWLNRVDSVDEPTWDQLISALKDVGEVATAGNIRRTKEEMMLPTVQQISPSQDTSPASIADVLQNFSTALEQTRIYPMKMTQMFFSYKCISETTLDEVEILENSLDAKKRKLLSVISGVVSLDHKILKVLATVLSKFEETRILSHKIYNEYIKFFPEDLNFSVAIPEVPLYNSSQMSCESHASDILRYHYGDLSLSLYNPVYIAQLLCGEKVITSTECSSIESPELSQSERITITLRAIRLVVHTSYHNLEVFASVLLNVPENVQLANAILNDCRKAFDRIPYIPQSMSPRFGEIRAEFAIVLSNICQAIKTSDPPIQVDALKQFLQDGYPYLKHQLDHTSSIDNILDLIKEKSTLIDLSFLEVIAKRFDVKEATQQIQAYLCFLAERCKSTSDFLDQTLKVTRLPHLLQCETATFFMNWEPQTCTLTDIENILSNSLGKNVQVRQITTRNSITITCYFPLYLTPFLIAKAQETLEVVKKSGLIKLIIGHCVIFDKHKIDQEVKSLEMTLEEKQRESEKLRSQLEIQFRITRKMTQEDEDLKSRPKVDDSTLEKLKTKSTEETYELERDLKGMEDMSKLGIKTKKRVSLEIKLQKEEQSLQEIITSLTLQLKEKEERNIHLTENIKDLRSRIVEVRDLLKTSHPLLSQKLEEPLDSKQEDIEAYELVDKMKTLEDLTSTVQEREATDRQQEIIKLQEMISSLTLQLTEKDIIVTQLTSKDTDEKKDTHSGQQESSDKEEPSELPKDTGSVEWTSDSVILTSSTVEECKEVIHQLKRRQHTTWWIKLKSLSPQSLLTLLIDINECKVRRLDIMNTHFDSNCVSQLSQVVTYNKTMAVLVFYSSPLLPNTYHLLTTAVTNNIIIKRLALFDDNNITDKDIPHLSHLIANNKTLQLLYLTKCPNITEFGEQQLQDVLVKNNSLNVLYINGNKLR